MYLENDNVGTARDDIREFLQQHEVLGKNFSMGASLCLQISMWVFWQLGASKKDFFDIAEVMWETGNEPNFTDKLS